MINELLFDPNHQVNGQNEKFVIHTRCVNDFYENNNISLNIFTNV